MRGRASLMPAFANHLVASNWWWSSPRHSPQGRWPEKHPWPGQRTYDCIPASVYPLFSKLNMTIRATITPANTLRQRPGRPALARGAQKGWKACLHLGRRSETAATAAAGEKKRAARQNSTCAGSRVRLYNQSLMVALPATGGAQQDRFFRKIAPRFNKSTPFSVVRV